MRNFIKIILILLLITGLAIGSINYFFGPTNKMDQEEIFIIPESLKNFDIVNSLQKQHLVKKT